MSSNQRSHLGFSQRGLQIINTSADSITKQLGASYLEMLRIMEQNLPAMEQAVQHTENGLEKRLRQELGPKMSPWNLQENLLGVQVVKGFAREPHEIGKFHAQTKDVLDQRIKIMRYFSINFPAMFTIVFISTALILYFGGREVIAGQMTVGTLVAFNGYVAMLGMPMRRLGFFINQFSEAIASADRIFELLDERVRICSPKDAHTLERIEGRVVFENVSFRYRNSDEYVLRDLDILERINEVYAAVSFTVTTADDEPMTVLRSE